MGISASRVLWAFRKRVDASRLRGPLQIWRGRRSAAWPTFGQESVSQRTCQREVSSKSATMLAKTPPEATSSWGEPCSTTLVGTPDSRPAST